MENGTYALYFWTDSLKNHSEGICKISFKIDDKWVHISSYKITVVENKVGFSRCFGESINFTVYNDMSKAFSNYLNIKYNRPVIINPI